MTNFSWLQSELERYDQEGWPTTCVVWPHGRSSAGYGQVWVPALRRVEYVHRVVSGGGEATRHDCDNPPCFNRTHLAAGTQAENIADMVAKARHATRGLPPEQRADIVNRYLAGERSSSIAADLGITIGHVSRLVRKAGHGEVSRARWGKQGRGRDAR